MYLRSDLWRRVVYWPCSTFDHKIAVFNKRKTTFDFCDGKNRNLLIKNKSKLKVIYM